MEQTLFLSVLNYQRVSSIQKEWNSKAQDECVRVFSGLRTANLLITCSGCLHYHNTRFENDLKLALLAIHQIHRVQTNSRHPIVSINMNELRETMNYVG